MAGTGVAEWFAPTLSALLERRDLAPDAMAALMEGLLHGECGEAEIAALLVALRMKGETAEELASAAGVIRRYCMPIDVGQDVLDTCGTGGDGQGTFNISTATALVVAGAGVRVVKHGNRAVSSQSSGSADVLHELGVDINCDPATVRQCLEGAGIAFCLAPLYHPALRHVGAVRRRLGVRTMFNCLGPLANPARAPYQLLGVGRPEWLERMAGALAILGTRFALLVHARDGLDEVTLSAPTMVRQVCGHEVMVLEWTPADFGLDPCGLDELRTHGARASAAVIRSVLAGDERRGNPGPATRIVLANAAAALLAAGAVRSLRDGVARAAEAITSGRAAATLAALVKLSGGPS
jgi:anthranilate phosphoribosyltransferase